MRGNIRSPQKCEIDLLLLPLCYHLYVQSGERTKINKIQNENVRVNRVVRNNVQLLGRLMHTITVSIDSEEGDLYTLYFVLLPTTPLYFNFSTIHIC